jgi:DNA-binding response OmpR family regulator
MKSSILLLEDEIKLAEEVKFYLESQNYQCDVSNDGPDFLERASKGNYDLYILDINVPRISGLEICKIIRESNKIIPIIMLTAFGEVSDKVSAFDSGADDYLVKPFHFEELTARINSALRRSVTAQTTEKAHLIQVHDLEINTARMIVKRKGVGITLTPKEYHLLELLGKSAGKPVSKQQISEQVWGINFDTGTNTIEVYINFLRNKIDKNHEHKLIHTRPGFGYLLMEPS